MPAGREDALAEFVRGGAAFALHNEAGNTHMASAKQAKRVVAAGDDEDDLVWQPSVGTAVEQVLQGGAAPAEEDGEPKRIRDGPSLRRVRHFRLGGTSR